MTARSCPLSASTRLRRAPGPVSRQSARERQRSPRNRGARDERTADAFPSAIPRGRIWLPTKVGPRRANDRPRGTERANSRRASQATSAAFSPERIPTVPSTRRIEQWHAAGASPRSSTGRRDGRTRSAPWRPVTRSGLPGARRTSSSAAHSAAPASGGGCGDDGSRGAEAAAAPETAARQAGHPGQSEAEAPERAPPCT